MRWVAVVLVAVLVACTQGFDERRPAPDERPAPSPGEPVGTATAAPELPAVEPQRPSLAAFAAEVSKECRRLQAAVAAAPLSGDPFVDGAGPTSRRAAVAHYRAMSAAWTAAAERLWEFGVPRRPVGQRLVSAFDVVASYAGQTADYLADGDDATAQLALGALDGALRDADRLAKRMGLPPLEQCDDSPRRLRGATRVRVTAQDFSFDVRDVVPRGPVRFVLRNRGGEAHQLAVVRLRQSGTLSDALRADREGDDPGRYLRGRGRSSVRVLPGGRATLDVRLRPGPYALICFVASPDGTPHAFKGMATEVAVSP